MCQFPEDKPEPENDPEVEHTKTLQEELAQGYRLTQAVDDVFSAVESLEPLQQRRVLCSVAVLLGIPIYTPNHECKE